MSHRSLVRWMKRLEIRLIRGHIQPNLAQGLANICG
jgi:hypothetical protein